MISLNKRLQIILSLIVVLLSGSFFSCRMSELNDISYKFLNDSMSLIDTVDYNYLKNKYPLKDTLYLCRLEREVQFYEKFDTINYKRSNNVVFAGSSTMRIWNRRLMKDMQPLPVIGRGFGGSTLIDNIYFFDRLILHCKPVIEVFYCANDFSSSPNTIYELFRYYDYLFHSHFPNSTLYFVSINPSIARKDYNMNIDYANKLICEYTKHRSMTIFINTYDSIIPNGILDTSLLSADSLHLNDKGYDLLTNIIKPIIIQKFNN